WTGFVQPLYTETYTFYTNSDDGIRLWVNNVLLIDSWVDQDGSIQKSGTIALLAGQKYDIKIEFYEKAGSSVTKLFWSSPSTAKAIVPKSQLYPAATTPPPTGAGIGLQADYFNGMTLSGAPLLTRIDTSINFVFDYIQQPVVLSPAPGIVPDDLYSVRWTGFVQPLYAETYTFYTNSDDGIRLWVNNVLLVDSWIDQDASIQRSGSIALLAGQKYDIKIEFYEKAGASVTKLYWSSASTPKAIVPKSQLFPPVSNARMMDHTASLKSPATDALAFAFTTASVSPNPVKRGQPARLQINSSRTGTAVVSVMSSNGNRTSNQTINLVKGINITTVNTNALAQGLYLISITGGNKPLTMKLIIQ
ncbi:MAG TPA: PA14 domain-containing protein, partial [Chitinophagaceae bacterium]|nr:PA14 domain-containing protein [Chitinophagaceae bacterium]